jgi:hypothetical protein
MRIRTIKPEFFHHEGIYEAELQSNLPLRLAFIGLWCAAMEAEISIPDLFDLESLEKDQSQNDYTAEKIEEIAGFDYSNEIAIAD